MSAIPMSATLTRQLAKLARMRMADVAFQPLTHDPQKPRQCRQRSKDWHAHRRGRLTASSFSNVLGFGSHSRRLAALQQLTCRAACSADAFFDEGSHGGGSQWGILHERSALATYLTAFVQPRSRSARLLETGFWPIGAELCHAVCRGSVGVLRRSLSARLRIHEQVSLRGCRGRPLMGSLYD